MEGSVEPTPEATPATFKPPLLRHDWDMRDEETGAKTKNRTKDRIKEVDIVPPDYHSDTLLSSEDDNPLLTEVCTSILAAVGMFYIPISISVARRARAPVSE